ncbi:MAG: hypothetical protein M3220_12975 [Chloroflexota bacterium]|nr:hypothetical protein [Chloroflexota bacterium]
MRRFFEQIAGLAMILAALLGLGFILLGLFYLPRVEGATQQRVQDTLAILDGTLETTAGALGVVEQSLEDATATMDTVEGTTRGISVALSESLPLLETVADIAGEELPASLLATQRSFETAESSAAAVEAVLFALNNSLSLFGGIPLYDPETPLATTIASVSDSLEPLPESLLEIESSIRIANDNIREVRANVETLANNLDQINRTLDNAQEVTTQYQEVVTQQQALVEDLQANADSWVYWTARVVAMILIWLAVAQVGLLSQGIELLRQRHRGRDAAPPL